MSKEKNSVLIGMSIYTIIILISVFLYVSNIDKKLDQIIENQEKTI